ncbi:hypothetical protein CTI12_AA028590 [Artemisia annua]|uniref:Uncharacterized protein n=1 Tax=Artemisia annua TaxID=35608 RepID=A0A2U1QHS0_ARTAN|nr:hypothetical protein CTI12_AA028590 [Artemisia annua]
MDPHVKLQADMGTPFPDPEVYIRYIRKHIYLTITRPDICYIVQLLSQFTQTPTSVHTQDVNHLLRLLFNLPDLGLKDLGPVSLKCDNQAALYIAANQLFHARKKHIEMDCHYARDQIKNVLPSHVFTKAQLADVFTKVLPADQHSKLLSKLGVCSSSTSQLKGECIRGVDSDEDLNDWELTNEVDDEDEVLKDTLFLEDQFPLGRELAYNGVAF